MKHFKLNHISKEDFFKIKEDDVMFITHPGRMGDEDGSNIIIKKDNSLIYYRVDHWLYNPEKCEITYEDVKKNFPKWIKEFSDNAIDGKYKFFYMGFGNNLGVDKSIADVFEKHLEKCIIEYAKKEELDIESHRMGIIYNTWYEAAYLTAKELKFDIEYTDEETYY